MSKLKIFLIATFSFCTSLSLFSQEITADTTRLYYQQKAEFNLFGAGVNYEVPVSEAMTLDSGIGFTGGIQVIGDKLHYERNITKPCFYAKSELKYYYNRKDRIANGFATKNNAGSYFGLQAKMITQRLFDKELPLSNIILTEVHWGIQRSLCQQLLVNLHVGVGRAYDFTYSSSSNYAAIGVKFSYLISNEKFSLSKLGL